MRIYALSDIHGCNDVFCTRISQLEALGALDTESKDTIVLLGDYVDRGPNSLGVVQKVIELQRHCPSRVIPLMGNHEYEMLQWLGADAYSSTREDVMMCEEVPFSNMPFDDEWSDGLHGEDLSVIEACSDFDLAARVQMYQQADTGYLTMRSFPNRGAFERFERDFKRKKTKLSAFSEACKQIKSEYPELVNWMRELLAR